MSSSPPQHHIAAVVEHQHRGHRKADHHDGLDGHHAQHRVEPGGGEAVVGVLKLFPLVVLPDVGLHHPHGDEVFLHRLVEVVQGLLHLLEEGEAHLHQQPQGRGHEGQHHAHHQGQAGTDGQGERHAGRRHGDAPDEHPQAHDGHVLDVGQVVGEPGDEGRGGEPVDVREGEGRDLFKLRPAQVGAQALGGEGGAPGGVSAHHRGHQGHRHHQRSGLPDHRHIVPLDALVDDSGHEQGEDKLTGCLQHHQQRGGDGVTPVALEVRGKAFQQW